MSLKFISGIALNLPILDDYVKELSLLAYSMINSDILNI